MVLVSAVAKGATARKRAAAAAPNFILAVLRFPDSEMALLFDMFKTLLYQSRDVEIYKARDE